MPHFKARRSMQSLTDGLVFHLSQDRSATPPDIRYYLIESLAYDDFAILGVG